MKDLKLHCRQLLQSGEKEAISAHFLLLLTWNLMYRTSNTSNIRFNHMKWREDAFEILSCHSKTDLGGEATEPRHLYANPHDFGICLITVLAHISSWPSTNCFLGAINQYERFRHIVFLKIYENLFIWELIQFVKEFFCFLLELGQFFCQPNILH